MAIMAAPVKKVIKEREVTIFVQIDALNNTKTASGSINSVPYEYERGTKVTVPRHIGDHMVLVKQAIYV